MSSCKQSGLSSSLRKYCAGQIDVSLTYIMAHYCRWENRFEKKVASLRENELALLWSYIFSSASYRILWTATPVIVSFVTFATMVFMPFSSDSILSIFAYILSLLPIILL